jgi:hydroxyethylthiazole kinase-like uncharacterized protein yjeF
VIRALSAEQARAVEERAVAEQGVALSTLMRAAGAAVATAVEERVPEGELVVLAGPGNNGGDGWVAAHDLHASGRAVRVLSLIDPHRLHGIAAEAALGALTAGVHWRLLAETSPDEALAGAACVVDALLGIGAKGALREPLGEWARAANESGAYVVAVDIPSGVDTDTGTVAGVAIDADCTVTFSAPKRGLVLYPGAGLAGEVVVASVGIAPQLIAAVNAPEVWESAEYARLLPLPAPDAHKNSRGRVLVIAGSRAYPGAAILCARGAMRSGAGYVTLAVPEGIVELAQSHIVAAPVVGMPQGRAHALSSAAADRALELAREFDAVVIGPGLSQADGAAATVRRVVSGLALPLVIDADALNALVDAADILAARTAPTILTPHPGELGRLLGCSAAEVNADRVSSSAKLSRAGRVVVLKGAGTVISEGERQLVNTSGSAALATAGTGDVLAGMLGGLLATGLPAFEAAALGVYVHGRAGEAAAAELTPVCVSAEDVPRFIPAAVSELLESW